MWPFYRKSKEGRPGLPPLRKTADKPSLRSRETALQQGDYLLVDDFTAYTTKEGGIGAHHLLNLREQVGRRNNHARGDAQMVFGGGFFTYSANEALAGRRNLMDPNRDKINLKAGISGRKISDKQMLVTYTPLDPQEQPITLWYTLRGKDTYIPTSASIQLDQRIPTPRGNGTMLKYANQISAIERHLSVVNEAVKGMADSENQARIRASQTSSRRRVR